MYVLVEITASNTSAFVGNVYVSNDLEKIQNVMNTDFECDLRKANDFWMDCGSHKFDKLEATSTPYYAKIKTPTEFKSWSIVETPGDAQQ